MRQRVQILLDENHRLRAQVSELTEELAVAYGNLRAPTST